MRQQRSKWDNFFWVVFIFILTTVNFAVAYYLTNFLYQSLHFQPGQVIVQIINSFLGLIFTGLIIRLFSRYFMQRQFNTFQPLIDAMERISKGDFSIHLDDETESNILSDLNASVNKMAAELGQMENMRQEFVSNVSHEIQSPLTSIRGFAEVLQNDQLSLAERRHYLEIIETESRRLSRLADDLLKLASLESDETKFEPIPYALDKQIRNVVLLCEPQWSAKQINIEVELANIIVKADPDLMNQVWLNLLTNSIKFTPARGSICLKLSEQGKQAVFSITDSGIGISSEELVHIFERFFKADKSRTRTKEGSGLGLSIVKKIVEIHHASIDVKSTPGKGTTFIVSLPLQQVHV